MRLPAEYQELEWIQSDGNQYINTGYIPNNKTEVRIKFNLLSETNNRTTIYGCFNTSSGSGRRAFCLQFNPSGDDAWASIYSNAGSYQIYISAPMTTNTVYETIQNHTNFYVNGGSMGTYSSGTYSVGYNMTLFGGNEGGSFVYISAATMKLYYCSIYDDGDLVKNFVPCYRKSDGVAGLYDLVGNTFYVNQGSGTFIKGPAVNNKVKKVYIGTKLIRPKWEPNESTLAYYPLKTDAKDHSGNDKHITNYNFTFDSNGYANFNGSQKGLVPNITGYKTISLWCNATSFNFMVFSGGSDYQYYPQVQSTRTSQGNGSSSGNYDTNFGRTLSTGERHLFTLSQDNGYVNLYLDGKIYDTRSLSAFSRAIKNIGWGEYWNRYYMNGKLSNVIIESKARTYEQIKDYYDSTKALYGINN